MKPDFEFEEDEQLDMFCFMDETERDKEIYEASEDISVAEMQLSQVNALCKTCKNCQYKSISKHTKELSCTMFDCDVHRTFSVCRGFEA